MPSLALLDDHLFLPHDSYHSGDASLLTSTMVLSVLAVLFLNVGGSSLDTHHGFVVEYAMDRDLDLGESLQP